MKIFCSGIGGIGLSAYAAYQRSCGHAVSGSDRTESATLADLEAQGIPISLEQDGSVVPRDVDLFVYTLALPKDHPELLWARQLGIPQKTYFEALGDLTRSSKKQLIAVSGTHGKSSTTAMAAKVLIEAGLDPSVILGTKTKDLDGRNWRKGGGRYFLAEACEYHRSFLHLSPMIVLLTNADGDHFDVFANLQEYQRAFEEFIAKLPNGGTLITHCTDHALEPLVRFARESSVRVVDADTFAPPSLMVPGHHMRENAKLVLALAATLGLDCAQAEASLMNYVGSWRRMEVKGVWRGQKRQEGKRGLRDGVLVIDDYGHHPREVAATLQALREAYPHRRIICVFQPHTHDRTLKFYETFSAAFNDADIVIIPNIYDARPQPDAGKVNVQKFVHDIAKESRTEVFNGKSLEETEALLRTTLKKGDLLVTMGAGDVWKVADALLA